MILAAVIAVVWVLAYIVAGWWGVGFMALLGFVGEVAILLAEAHGDRTHRNAVVKRWESWND
jgi:uncharacterized protein (DUF58 family)